MGASSGDTLRLVQAVPHLRSMLWQNFSDSLGVLSTAQNLDVEVDQLKVENTRLRSLLAEKVVNSTMLTGLVPDDGGMTLGFEGGACGMLAQLLGAQFYESQAINYLELRFNSAKHPDLGPLVVTLQRVEGPTPHELRAKAEAEIASLQKHIAENATAGAAQVQPMKTSTVVLLGLAGTVLSFVLAGIAATWKPFPEHAWVADRKVQLKPALASDDPMLQELAAWERSQKAAKP